MDTFPKMVPYIFVHVMTNVACKYQDVLFAAWTKVKMDNLMDKCL